MELKDGALGDEKAGWWETETETEYTEKSGIKHDATFYEVTVPSICDGCPEITIYIGSEEDCDCGSLNTKCDDDHEPEYEIDLRSELTN